MKAKEKLKGAMGMAKKREKMPECLILGIISYVSPPLFILLNICVEVPKSAAGNWILGTIVIYIASIVQGVRVKETSGKRQKMRDLTLILDMVYFIFAVIGLGYLFAVGLLGYGLATQEMGMF